MNMLVAGLEGCAVYLDDVVVFSETWDDDIQRICALFGHLAEACLTVNLACEFAKVTVTYLGQMARQGQVCPIDAKVSAVMQYPLPTTKKAIFVWSSQCQECF